MKDFLLLAGLLLVLIVGFMVVNKNSNRNVDTVFPRPIEEIKNTPDAPAPVPNTNPKSVTLKLHEQTTFGDIIVEPWAVTEDSRCPQDVQCIQAGRARVAINVLDKNSAFIQSADIQEGAFVTVKGVKITLSKVAPYPVSITKTADDQYRFTFDFALAE